jgi:tetratricopeptide (TPR) repeat protein
MMEETPLFLGRDRELARMNVFVQRLCGLFGREQRPLLKRLLGINEAPTIPLVMLISGQGGIGKTRLLIEFRALIQREYPSGCYVTEIDWQRERQANETRFASGPYDVDLNLILQVMNRRMGDTNPNYDVDANEYTRTSAQIQEAQVTAARIASELGNLSRPGGATLGERETGMTEAIANTGAKVVSELASVVAGPFGKALEPFANALIKQGVHLTPQTIARVQKRLKEPQLRLLTEPAAYAARALGDTLRAASADRPIVMTLDTYEIVDELDPYVRMIIKAAGRSVGWIIAGRRDLYATRTYSPHGRIDGYREENGQSYEVEAFDLGALARHDIGTYFRQRAPGRQVLDDDDLKRVDRATGAIPLAIQMAADIWEATGRVADIVSEELRTNTNIVDEMVNRYEQHCVNRDADRRTLAAQAMSDGDARILRAMLLPEFDNDEDRLERHMEHVRHRYASVQRPSVDNDHLHDEPARFFNERLRSAQWRERLWVRQFNQRALQSLCGDIQKRQVLTASLEKLCTDADYVNASVKVARFLLWLNHDDAWAWVTARLVEGLAFNSALVEGIAQELSAWRPYLDDWAHKQIDIVSRTSRYADPEGQESIRKMLTEGAERGWLADSLIDDRYTRDRMKVLEYVLAASYSRSDLPREALQALQRTFGNLRHPKDPIGPRVANLAHGLSLTLEDNNASGEAERALRLAVETDSESAKWPLEYAAFLLGKKRYWAADEQFARAITLAPNNADNHFFAGRNYADSNRHAAAVASFLTSIRINPDDPNSWIQLGYSHRILRDYDAAIDAHRRALVFDEHSVDANLALGWDYASAGDHERAVKIFERLIEHHPLDAQPVTALANLLTGRVEWGRVTSLFEHAIELDPASYEAWQSLGYVHMACLKIDEAIEAYRRSIDADPKLTSAITWWGDLLFHQGRWAEAAEKYQATLDLDPAAPSSRASLIALNRIAGIEISGLHVARRDSEVFYEFTEAQWSAVAGDDDNALSLLATIIRVYPECAYYARFKPAFYPLRNHPTFRSMTREPGPAPL